MWNPDFASAMPEFFPPKPSAFWRTVFEPVRTYYLRKVYRISSIEIVGRVMLAGAIQPGDGVLVAPNHSHDSDPHVMLDVARRFHRQPYAMAAWQIFKMHGGIDGFFLQRMGAYSVDREGCDRRAMKQTMELLTGGKNVIVFPEGEVYRLNDRLTPLREGVAFMAAGAQRELDKSKSPHRVWIVPTAIRYTYVDDVRPLLEEAIAALEQRLMLAPGTGRPHGERLIRFGEVLLTIKEKEKLGHSREQDGDLPSRIGFLIEHLLSTREQQYLHKTTPDESVPVRVKTLRRQLIETGSAQPKSDESANRAITDALADVQLALQLFSYPGNYLTDNPRVERMAETVEKYEEDVLGVAWPKGRRSAKVVFGSPIDVRAQLTTSRARAAATELTERMESEIRSLMASS
jgi:1-acyl-sn-glycerol-3-phosphate acyltransferase